MDAREIAAVAQKAAAISNPGVLRFSQCAGPGRYRWHGVRTDDEAIVAYLCVCWNEREEIASILTENAG